MSNLDVDPEELQNLLSEPSRTVLADFWAPWCGPCRGMASAYAEFAADNLAIDVVKVDVDAHGGYTDSLGIQSVPTLILFQGGHEVKRHCGGMTKAQLAQFAGIPDAQPDLDREPISDVSNT